MTNLKTLLAAALVAASTTVALADNTRVDNAHLYGAGAATVLIEGRNAAEIDFPHSNDNGKLSASIYQVQRQPVAAIEGRNSADFRPVRPDAVRIGSDR